MKLSKAEARKARKAAKRSARAILESRFKVPKSYTQSYHSIIRYIRKFCPHLRFDGHQLLAEFAHNHPRTYTKESLRSSRPVSSDAFLESYEWRKIRMQVLVRDGARCACCGATRHDGRKMHVDHIKPRRLFPELALDLKNLQVLCDECNHGKGNWDQTDWRNDFSEASIGSKLRVIK